MKKILTFISILLMFGTLAIPAKAQTDIDPNGRTFSQIFDSLSTGLNTGTHSLWQSVQQGVWLEWAG